MDNDYQCADFTSLGHTVTKDPILSESCNDIFNLLEHPPVSQLSHLNNSPETPSQHTFGQEFSFQDPVPNVLKVLDIPTEKFPLQIEQVDQMNNRDNINLTNLNKDVIFPTHSICSKALQNQQPENTRRTSPKLISVLKVHEHAISKAKNRSHKEKSTSKVGNIVLSTKGEHFASKNFKIKETSKAVPIFTMNKVVNAELTTKESSSKINNGVKTQISSKKNKLPTHTKYRKLSRLVNDLIQAHQPDVTEHDKLHSNVYRTGKIMYDLSIEVAKLIREDHWQTMSLCTQNPKAARKIE